MNFRGPLLVLTAIVLAVSPSRAGEICHPDWGTAGDIVRAHGLRTIEQLAETAPQQLKGEIVKATLCEDGTRYLYRLVVRDRSGQLKNVVMGAADEP